MIIPDRDFLGEDDNFWELADYVSKINFEDYGTKEILFNNHRNDFRKKGLFLIDASAIAFRKKSGNEPYTHKVSLFVGDRNLGMKNMAQYFSMVSPNKTRILGLDYVLIYDNKKEAPVVFSSNNKSSLLEVLLNKGAGMLDSVFIFKKSSENAYVDEGSLEDAAEHIFFTNGTMKHSSINDKRARKSGIAQGVSFYNVRRKHEMQDLRGIAEMSFDIEVYDEQRKLYHQIKRRI